jgi:prepilin signal peptidase PulO-like enzyme (type II secretory pathway)
MQMLSTLILPVLAGGACAALVNYLCDVLPRTRRLSAPACTQCGTTYSWPAYALSVKCPACGHRRGLRPWLTALALIGLSLYVWVHSPRMGYWAALLVLGYFAVVVVIDVEHRLILGPVSAAGAALGVVIGGWQHGPVATLLGGIAGFLLMYSLFMLGVLFSRWRAGRLMRQGRAADEEEALGWGDVTLGVVLGLLLGWPLFFLALLLGILIGGAIGLIIVIAAVLRGAYGRQALTLFMPYGPSLVIGASCILFLPDLVSTMLPK